MGSALAEGERGTVNLISSKNNSIPSKFADASKQESSSPLYGKHRAFLANLFTLCILFHNQFF